MADLVFVVEAQAVAVLDVPSLEHVLVGIHEEPLQKHFRTQLHHFIVVEMMSEVGILVTPIVQVHLVQNLKPRDSIDRQQVLARHNYHLIFPECFLVELVLLPAFPSVLDAFQRPLLFECHGFLLIVVDRADALPPIQLLLLLGYIVTFRADTKRIDGIDLGLWTLRVNRRQKHALADSILMA